MHVYIHVCNGCSFLPSSLLPPTKILPYICWPSSADHLTSASSNWPTFQHILPEIAIAGHSNCGKSTLVNVMAGFSHREGPASVSDRAGWTDQICFYQVCMVGDTLSLMSLMLLLLMVLIMFGFILFHSSSRSIALDD